MTKKLFIKLSMLLFVLGMSTNVAWADDVKIYFASLKALSSPESTGSGEVKLTWVDITGAPMTVELAKQLNYAAFQDPEWMTKESAYDGFGEAVQVLGGTTSALDGMETMIATAPQIFMTSFVYYYAQAQPANGSYFADWTFIDPAITRVVEPMGGVGNYTMMQTINNTLHTSNHDYNNPLISPCFKVLPDSANNAVYSDTEEGMAVVGAKAYEIANTPGKYKILYAVFNKYLLSNPQAENGNMNANEASTTFKVSVDVEGDASQLKADYADFVFPASNFVDNAEGTWSWAHDSENPIEHISATKTRYNFTITFTPKTTSEGRKNATLTIRMAHANPAKASTLNLPLSVDVRPAATADATLYDGKTPTATFGPLNDMIAAANNTDKIVVLNRDYTAALNVNANVTIDLNGYDITNSLTVSGGDVTIAYSKFGGNISSVNVSAGKLTFNGGTIDASGAANVTAVTVAAGATLVQNGATIKAKTTTVMATGIEVNGTVEINDGVMTAHADQFGAFVVNVKAGGKLTVNGGTLSATVNQTNDPTPNPSNQATWSNVYAVFVSSGTGEAEINGGTFNATSDYASAFAVCGLASMGKLTIEKKAVVNAHSGCDEPTAYAVGLLNESNTINEADATINGGKFSATYMEGGSVVAPCRPFLCAVYKNLTFKSGYINADSVYVRNTGMFPMSGTPVNPTLYNVVRDSKDWNEGWRFIAVDESKTTTLASGVPACRIGNVGYTKLEDAIAYANNNPSEENIVIFMTNHYTLPAGYYTLPANATIVVPMSDTQAKEVNKTAPRVIFNDADRSTPYEQPSEFRRLTLASGVNMDVFGDIEMTCSQFASNEAYTGQPYGPYGHIVMEEGSHMTLQNGSEVRAWGYMTGKGETDARRGAVVREMFQLGDWKGAFTSVRIVGMAPAVGDDSDKKIFPVTQYFIQNIECPVKYHPGSLLSTSAAVSEGLGFLSVSMTAADIGLIGVSRENQGGEDDPAIFLMDIAADAENTWVRKWYDVENDIQVYDINSGAHIGSMVLDMGELFVPLGNLGTVPIKLNSAKFDLPLTCNFKIHLLTGGMDFKQNTCLLPGAEVEVDKESTVKVAMNSTEKAAYTAWVDGGKVGDAPVCYTGALYVYDSQDWSKYAYVNAYGQQTEDYSAYTKVVRYSPSWNGRPTKRAEQTCPDDAKINVRGTFETATGFVYTSEHGANIFSTNEDAGTFIFNEDASRAENPRKVYQVRTSGNGALGRDTEFDDIDFYPARLKNGNQEYVNTDAAVAGDAYCYHNDEWSTMVVDEDNPCFMKTYNGNTETYTYYAKPAEYIAVNATKIAGVFSGNSDNTYSDAAGAGRLFILMEDECQWWEVENVDNLYHCIHPDNDTYYYWGEDENGDEKWIEKKFTITWKNWDGTPIDTDNGEASGYEVTYGTMAEFLGTNPTREKTVDYTYDFTGWTPALGPVTSDVTYTATYEQKDRMYTITFLNEGGTLIEKQFLKHNDVPVCENTPTKVGHYLVWDPAISPVIGNAVYTATWEEDPPITWNVTFADYDGTVLKKKDASNEDATFDVPVNGTISDENLALVPTPTKKQTDQEALNNKEYNYEFDHWQPATTDPVTQPTIYTAVYREVARTYTVRFYQEDGITPIGAAQSLAYGATPVAPNYSKEEPGYTITVLWKNKDDASKTIETVMEDADYIADVTTLRTRNRYTVTLRSNNESVCTFTGSGIYNYESPVTIGANIAPEYDFVRWEGPTSKVVWTDGTHGSIASLTEDITLTLYVQPTDVASLEDLTAEVSDELNIASGTKCKDFVLTSNGTSSGQVVSGISNLTVFGNAYYDLAIGAAARTWYAVAVPWQVEVSNGIYVNGNRQRLNKDFYLLWYDSQMRANEGAKPENWVFASGGEIMQPGTLYMIYMTNPASTIRFQKKAQAALQTTQLTVKQYPSANAIDAGWNGIANPALYHAYLNASSDTYNHVNFGQRYVPAEDRYDAVNMSDAVAGKLIVGAPIFVQVAANKTVPAQTTNTGFSAPARRKSIVDNAYYEVQISAGEEYTDRIYLQTMEDKEDQYVIGLDLAKAGVSTKVAQMWVNRYSTKLCVNTTAPIGSSATYPLGIFAPQEGDYQISSATEMQSGQEMFVTKDGRTIWNLAYGPYTATLTAGNHTEYGLKLIQAPATPTGVDPVTDNPSPLTVKKVLIDNHVYIIRDGEVYTVTGQKVQ